MCPMRLQPLIAAPVLLLWGCEADNPWYVPRRDLTAAAADLAVAAAADGGSRAAPDQARTQQPPAPAADLRAPAPPPPAPAGMVAVPGGTFLMGGDETADEQPRASQTIATFYLHRREVSVRAYRACVDAGKCAAPDMDTLDPNCNWAQSGHDDHPMNCLDWSQAIAYCAAQGLRLPTEIEWEYAARGSGASEYPWGSDAPDGRLCWKQAGTCPVGSYPETLLGAPAAKGLADMAGNVWEWTASFFPCRYPLDPMDPTCKMKADTSSRAIRGGAYDSNKALLVSAPYRNGRAPISPGLQVGFRCAGDP